MEDVLVWNHGTVDALVKYASASPEAEAHPKKDEIDDLADDEVARLLAAELDLGDRIGSA
jgi:hypothetical protein